jgi:hypothetical protein
MRIARLSNLFLMALGLATLVALSGDNHLLAQKKGGGTTAPPPAPGTIYFSGRMTTKEYSTGWSMNGDGTGKQQRFGGIQWRPTYQLHGGTRWMLEGASDMNGPLDENGIPPYEMWATNGGLHIQLTGGHGLFWGWGDYAAWGKDDSFVSYQAWWFNEFGGVSGGLFVIDIDWSTGIPVVASDPVLIFEAEAIWFGGWEGAVNINEHDWSPNGQSVIFHEEDETVTGTTYVADLSGGSVAFRSLGQIINAVWSPNGSRIAFGNGGIWTSAPDGTNAIRLTQSTVTSSEERSQSSPNWSPDGAYIAFNQVIKSKNSFQYSIWRIPSGGGTAVNLTSDLTYATGPKWRP